MLLDPRERSSCERARLRGGIGLQLGEIRSEETKQVDILRGAAPNNSRSKEAVKVVTTCSRHSSEASQCT